MFTSSGLVFVYPCNTAIAWFSSLEENILMFEGKMYEAVFFSSDLPSEGVLLFKGEDKYIPIFIGDSFDLQDNWNDYQEASGNFIEHQFTNPKITHTFSISYLAHSESFYDFPAEVLKLYASLLKLRSISDLLGDDKYSVPSIYRRVVIDKKTYHIFAGEEVEGYIIENGEGDIEVKSFEPGSINLWGNEALYCAFVKD